MAVSFEVTAEPMPSNFRGTPQQMLEAWIDRIRLSADNASFVISDVMPTEDQGPWLKNGTQLWVFNGTTYQPLDVSESLDPEIFVGEDEPDPGVYNLWFRLDGSTVVGLFAYLGGAWVTQDTGLAPKSIQTIHIANLAVTEDKIADGSVGLAALANSIPLAKWEGGAANTFARMDLAGASPEWTFPRLVSSDLPISASTNIEFFHGLPFAPHRVSAVLVAQPGRSHPVVVIPIAAGDERNVASFVTGGAQQLFCVVTPSKVYVKFGTNLRLVDAYVAAGGLENFSDWKLRFYITPI